jgi:hypothetical protein
MLLESKIKDDENKNMGCKSMPFGVCNQCFCCLKNFKKALNLFEYDIYDFIFWVYLAPHNMNAP